MHGMVNDAFHLHDEPHDPVQPLESQLGNIVMDAFNIVDELDNVLDDKSDDSADDEPMGTHACSIQGAMTTHKCWRRPRRSCTMERDRPCWQRQS